MNSVYHYAERLKMGNYKYEIDLVHRREKTKIEAKRLAALFKSKILDIKTIWGFGSVFKNNKNK